MALGRRLQYDSMLGMLEFALDRDIPGWVRMATALPILHLGPGNKVVLGSVEMDWPEYDFDGARTPVHEQWCGIDDGTIGGIVACHVLEHLADPRPLLRECSRVLAPGCPFNIFVPHAQTNSYLQDLDHKTPFVIDTWKNLLSNPYYSKGHDGLRFEIGLNIAFGVKDENLGILTQLIKLG
jgi:SAM-dependent methyltransferase